MQLQMRTSNEADSSLVHEEEEEEDDDLPLARCVGGFVAGLLDDAVEDAVDEFVRDVEFECSDDVLAPCEPVVVEESVNMVEADDDGVEDDGEHMTFENEAPDGLCWALVAAELTEGALGAATRRLTVAQALAPLSSPMAGSACGSMRVNIGVEDDEDGVQMDEDISPVHWRGGLSACAGPHHHDSINEDEEVLSVASDSSWEERECASQAVHTMRIEALRVVNSALELGLTDEICLESPAGDRQRGLVPELFDLEQTEDHWAMEEQLADEHQLIQESFHPTSEWVFDYVCGLLDEGISSSADAVDAAAKEATPIRAPPPSLADSVAGAMDDQKVELEIADKVVARELQPCSRRAFAREFCPRAELAVSAVSPSFFSTEVPLVLPTPILMPVNWAVLRQPAKRAALAAPAVAVAPELAIAITPAAAEAPPRVRAAPVDSSIDAVLEELASVAAAAAPKVVQEEAPAKVHQETEDYSVDSLLAELGVRAAPQRQAPKVPTLGAAALEAAKAPVAASLPSARALSSSRSKRRIIGGIVRNAAPSEMADAGSLALSFGKSRKLAAPKPSLPAAIRMDLADDGDRAAARDSSLARGYEALGAEFHCLDAQEMFAVAAARPPSRSKIGALNQRGLSIGLGGSLRAASALALDLGEEAPREARLGRRPPSTATSQAASTPSRSTSLGAVQVSKSRVKELAPIEPIFRSNKVAPNLLPTLPGHSAGSVAWSIHMARSAPRRQQSPAMFSSGLAAF